jgi:hypothetical protein
MSTQFERNFYFRMKPANQLDRDSEKIMNDYPDDKYVKQVCLIGKGAACCRYLTMTSRGWSCAKHSDLKQHLDDRVIADSITAKGDNCPGKDSR